MQLPDVPEPRISRERAYFEQALVLRQRSSCLRGKVGCVAVDPASHRVIAQGYNGSPPGQPHCFELGCDVPENHHDAGCQRTIHAEANLIAWAARFGTPLKGMHLWSSHGPCHGCAKLILAAGFVAVHALVPYRLPEGDALLDSAAVPVNYYYFYRHVALELEQAPDRA
jgi:dCMP deaminase